MNLQKKSQPTAAKSHHFKKKSKSPTNLSSTLQFQNQSQSHSKQIQKKFKTRSIQEFLNHTLYRRYSSTQNYHYIKIINNIILEERSPSVFKFKDLQDYQSSYGTLLDYIPQEKRHEFMHNLAEYYKYHNEIPRIFCTEIFETYFDYHDLKRQLNYDEVTKKLQVEKGEDPYHSLKSELRQKRLIKYKPILSTLVTREKDSSQLSRTLEDIYRNLKNLKFDDFGLKMRKNNDVTFELSDGYEIKPRNVGTIVDLKADDFFDFENGKKKMILSVERKGLEKFKRKIARKEVFNGMNFKRKDWTEVRKVTWPSNFNFEKKSKKIEKLGNNIVHGESRKSKAQIKLNFMKKRSDSRKKKFSLKKKDFLKHLKKLKKKKQGEKEEGNQLSKKKRNKVFNSSRISRSKKKSHSRSRSLFKSQRKSSIEGGNERKRSLYNHKRVKSDLGFLNLISPKRVNTNAGCFKKLHKRTKSNGDVKEKKNSKKKFKTSRVKRNRGFSDFMTFSPKIKNFKNRTNRFSSKKLKESFSRNRVQIKSLVNLSFLKGENKLRFERKSKKLKEKFFSKTGKNFFKEKKSSRKGKIVRNMSSESKKNRRYAQDLARIKKLSNLKKFGY